jgi:hypothetical protein
MQASVLIFEPAGRHFGDLRREFRAETPGDWAVQTVSSTLLGLISRQEM